MAPQITLGSNHDAGRFHSGGDGVPSAQGFFLGRSCLKADAAAFRHRRCANSSLMAAATRLEPARLQPRLALRRRSSRAEDHQDALGTDLGPTLEGTRARVTPHQFRHAAAYIILKADPGNYELVRRVLGHRSITTTHNFYIGLETLEATRQFGEMVTGLERGEAPSKPPSKKTYA